MILATTQYVKHHKVLKLGIILLLKVYINVIQTTHNEFDCDHKITYQIFPTLGIFDKFFTSSNMGKTHVKPKTMSHSQSNS